MFCQFDIYFLNSKYLSYMEPKKRELVRLDSAVAEPLVERVGDGEGSDGATECIAPIAGCCDKAVHISDMHPSVGTDTLCYSVSTEP